MEIDHPFTDPGHPRHREFVTRYAQLGAATDIVPDEDHPERVRRPPSLVQLIARMEREQPLDPVPAILEPAYVPEPEPEISFTRSTRSRGNG